MSSTPRRAMREAFGIPDAGTRGATRGAARRPHPVRRLFGESRSVTWIVIAFLTMLSLIVVRPMVMSMMSYHRTAGLLAERRAEVHDLRSRHAKLLRQLAYYETDAFLAERAREYGLTRPGEQPYVIRELTRPGEIGRFTRNRVRNITSGPIVVPQPAPAAGAAAVPASNAPPAGVPATSSDVG